MSMTNPDSLATKQDLHEMYGRIYPFLEGGGSGGSGGHTIEDSTGNPLTQRDTMQFSDSFAPTDDSTNEVTKIELNKLDSGEMDDIVTPLPSVQARYHKYSTDEHIVGEWIDGSYIYELTKELPSVSLSQGANTIPIISVTGKNLLFGIGRIIYSDNAIDTIPFNWGGTVDCAFIGVSTSNIDINLKRASPITVSLEVTIWYTKTTS